jgi:uncharacterized DUF497 family protein
MTLSWDEEKRLKTLAERGLDFADCDRIFAGPTIEFPDDRKDYGEERIVCIGLLQERIVTFVYTEREDSTRIISMRKANEREREALFNYIESISG